MKTATTITSLENLVNDLLNGDLSAERSSQLIQSLNNDPMALDEYLRLILVTASLRELHPHRVGETEGIAGRDNPHASFDVSNDYKIAYSPPWRWRAGMFLRAGLRALRAG